MLATKSCDLELLGAILKPNKAGKTERSKGGEE